MKLNQIFLKDFRMFQALIKQGLRVLPSAAQKHSVNKIRRYLKMQASIQVSGDATNEGPSVTSDSVLEAKKETRKV